MGAKTPRSLKSRAVVSYIGRSNQRFEPRLGKSAVDRSFQLLSHSGHFSPSIQIDKRPEAYFLAMEHCFNGMRSSARVDLVKGSFT